jgi:hypothetical protein
MPKYLVERTLPGAGSLSAADLQATAQKAVAILYEMGPDVQWTHSYVVGDKVFCVFNARDDELVREHSRRGGFPVDTVHRVATIIDPITAEV